MIVKYFDEFEGKWLDITGDTGSGLVYGVDGWETSAGFKKLVLLISQTGTNDPTYTELENTIGTNYNLTRNAAGDYRITLDDAILSQGKTFILIQQTDGNIIRIYRNSTTEIVIRTNNDGVLDFTSLEVRIYN